MIVGKNISRLHTSREQKHRTMAFGVTPSCVPRWRWLPPNMETGWSLAEDLPRTYSFGSPRGKLVVMSWCNLLEMEQRIREAILETSISLRVRSTSLMGYRLKGGRGLDE